MFHQCEVIDATTAGRFQAERQKLADGEAKKRLRAGGNYPTDGDLHPLRLCEEIKYFMQREAILSVVFAPDRSRRGGELLAAAGEATKINAAELSSAATVCAANVPPASKSCRSRKIGRRCLGIGPIGVSRPTKSLSMRKPSSRPCSRFAAAVSRWL